MIKYTQITSSTAHVTRYAIINTSTSIYNTISYRISKHMIYQMKKSLQDKNKNDNGTTVSTSTHHLSI